MSPAPRQRRARFSDRNTLSLDVQKGPARKFDRYERAGVREYWVIDPAAWSVWDYRPAGGRFDEGELKDRLGDCPPLASSVVEVFTVDLVELFAEMD